MYFGEYLSRNNILFYEKFNTSYLSSIKTGGIADFIVFPKNKDELLLVIGLCVDEKKRFKIIGGCTNTYFSDDGFSGVLISTKKMANIEIVDNMIVAEAGATLSKIIVYAKNNDIELKSELFGIPGTFGGAVRNNAGAFGSEISDVFKSGIFLDLNTLKTIEYHNKELDFAYRKSRLQDENIVFLYGCLNGIKNDRKLIEQKMNKSISQRRNKHPNQPSLGSFFKHSEGKVPAKLIEDAGLKGKRIGDAMVSQKHSGFIVNVANATSGDVNALAEYVEKTILINYNVKLLREAEYVI